MRVTANGHMRRSAAEWRGLIERYRQSGLEDEDKLCHRTEFAKPIVEAFFTWLEQTLTTQVLLPSNPFTHAARYALEREPALRVLLDYPNVPLDTNHLERAIRAIALDDGTGCSAGRRSARSMWASCRA